MQVSLTKGNFSPGSGWFAGADELEEAVDSLLDVGETEAAQQVGQLAAGEQAGAAQLPEGTGEGAAEGFASAATGEQGEAAAGGEDGGHAFDGEDRVVEQVQAQEAADRVEAAGAQGEFGGVGVQVGDVVAVGVGDGAFEHGRGGVDADGQAALADGFGQCPGEVAGAAGDVEDDVPGFEVEIVAGQAELARGGRAERALDGLAEDGAPPALVDAGHELGAHQRADHAGGDRLLSVEQIQVTADQNRRMRGLHQRGSVPDGVRELHMRLGHRASRGDAASR